MDFNIRSSTVILFVSISEGSPVLSTIGTMSAATGVVNALNSLILRLAI